MAVDVGALGGKTHACGHCIPYWARIRSGEFVVAAVEDRNLDCVACGRPMIAALVGDTWRCAECGVADLSTAGHVIELWWAEDPESGALSIGWGGSDIWSCSCGARDEDELGEDKPRGTEWAAVHAQATGGRVRDAGLRRRESPKRP